MIRERVEVPRSVPTRPVDPLAVSLLEGNPVVFPVPAGGDPISFRPLLYDTVCFLDRVYVPGTGFEIAFSTGTQTYALDGRIANLGTPLVAPVPSRPRPDGSVPNRYCYEVAAPAATLPGGAVASGALVSVAFGAPGSSTAPVGRTEGLVEGYPFASGPQPVALVTFGDLEFSDGSDLYYASAVMFVDTGKEYAVVMLSPESVEPGANSTLTAELTDWYDQPLVPPGETRTDVSVASTDGVLARPALIAGGDTTYVGYGTGEQESVTYSDLITGRIRIVVAQGSPCGAASVSFRVDRWEETDGTRRSPREATAALDVCGELVVAADELWPGETPAVSVRRRTPSGDEPLGAEEAVDLRLGPSLEGLVVLRHLDTGDEGTELQAVAASALAGGRVVLALVDGTPPPVRQPGVRSAVASARDQAGRDRTSQPTASDRLTPPAAPPHGTAGRPRSATPERLIPEGTVAGITVPITASLSTDSTVTGGDNGRLYPFRIDFQILPATVEEDTDVTGRAVFELSRLDHPAVQEFAGSLDVPGLVVQFTMGDLLDAETFAPVGVRPTILNANGGTVFTEYPDYTYVLFAGASVLNAYSVEYEFTRADPDVPLDGLYVADINVGLTRDNVFLRPESGASSRFDRWKTVDVGDGATAVVFLVRQNDLAVPTSGADAYVMVSKVRPDWLLPRRAQPFTSPFGSTPFLNVSPAAPPDASVFDPHTYRVQVDELPDSLTTTEALARFRFRYEVLRGGTVIYTSPTLVEGDSSDAARGTPSAGAIAGPAGGSGRTVRSRHFHRLVSNGPPSIGGKKGPYDDEIAGSQTILVALGDRLRVTAFVVSPDLSTTQTLRQATFPVGQDPGESGVDAIRQADLAWHTYQVAGGTVLASRPEEATARASEDWAQASIRLHELAAERDTFSSAGITNGIQLTVLGNMGRTQVGDTLRVDAVLPNGTAIRGVALYPPSSDARLIAEILAADLSAKFQPYGLGVYYDADGSSTNKSFAALVVGRLQRYADELRT